MKYLIHLNRTQPVNVNDNAIAPPDAIQYIRRMQFAGIPGWTSRYQIRNHHFIDFIFIQSKSERIAFRAERGNKGSQFTGRHVGSMRIKCYGDGLEKDVGDTSP